MADDDLYRPPAMPFYWDRFIADTADLSAEEVGVYVRLMGQQWPKGKIAGPLRKWAQIAGVSERTMKATLASIGDRLRAKPDDASSLYSPFMERVRERMRARNHGQSEAGALGGKSKWGSLDSSPGKRHERLRQARLLGTHTKEEWDALVVACGNRCVRCGNPDAKIVKDHIKIIAHGGSDHISNLQPLCGFCNASKGPEDIDFVPAGIRLASNCQTPSETPSERQGSVLPGSVLPKVTTVTPAAPAAEKKKREPSPEDLGAYAILSAALPVVLSSHSDLGCTQADWKARNKKAASRLFAAEKTPAQVVAKLEAAYASEFYAGITTLEKLIEHWPKIGKGKSRDPYAAWKPGATVSAPLVDDPYAAWVKQ